MKVGFTGTREGMTDAQQQAVAQLLVRLQPLQLVYEGFSLHHGDCLGSDAEAHDIARTYTSAKIVIHPPDKNIVRAFCVGTYSRDPKPYLDRNRDIVDETDVLIAAPKQTTEPAKPKAGGTWFTIRYARTLGRKIYIVLPRGRVEEEN